MGDSVTSGEKEKVFPQIKSVDKIPYCSENKRQKFMETEPYNQITCTWMIKELN